jgi:hypothetical protein
MGSKDPHVSTESEHMKCRQLRCSTALEMKAQEWKLTKNNQFWNHVTWGSKSCHQCTNSIWLPCSSAYTPLSFFDMYTKDVVYIPPLPTTLPEVAGRYCCGYITPAMLTDVWREPEYRDVTCYSESTVQCRPQKASASDLPKTFSFNSCVYQPLQWQVSYCQSHLHGRVSFASCRHLNIFI